MVHSSADVSRLTGVSLRQLQWWDEQRVVSPRHEGHKRVYSMEEVLEISMIAELRRKGFSLQKIRRVLKLMQKEMSRRLGQIMGGESEVHLLTDGKLIHLEDSPERIVELLAARGIQVSPAHVFVVQTVAKSARPEQVAAAS